MTIKTLTPMMTRSYFKALYVAYLRGKMSHVQKAPGMSVSFGSSLCYLSPLQNTKQDARFRDEVMYPFLFTSGPLLLTECLESSCLARPTQPPNRPRIKSKLSANTGHKASSKKNWPEYTDIVQGGLRDQSAFIRGLCRDAIYILELTLVTKEAWPELHRAAEFRVEVFL